MKISGFTIVRQAVRFGYPFIESIKSLLPMVDEMVIGIGDGDDGTKEAIKAIRDPRIKTFYSPWDLKDRKAGLVLSQQTNLALKRCQGDWAMYLQADEVLHEDDLDILKTSMQKHLNRRTQGLSFAYRHFYGSYQTIQTQWRKWYRKAVRAVKTGEGIESVGDAYGFKVRKGKRLGSLVKADSGARVFHYGWTRPPQTMRKKQMNLDSFYHDDQWIKGRYKEEDEKTARFYRDRGFLDFFRGTHPSVMNQRIAAQDWVFEHQIENQMPRWARQAYILLIYPVVKRLKRLVGRSN